MQYLCTFMYLFVCCPKQNANLSSNFILLNVKKKTICFPRQKFTQYDFMVG